MSKLKLTIVASIATALLALTPASAGATAAANPTTINFGSQTVGSTSGAQASVVNVTCTLFALTCVIEGHFTPGPVFSGANPGDFAQANNCPMGGIGTGGNCTFILTFTPTGVGARTATLKLGDEDGSGQPLLGGPDPVITLTGSGLAAPPPASTGSGGVAGQAKAKKCKKAKKKHASAAKKCKKKK